MSTIRPHLTAYVRTSTHDLGPLYPVKSSTTLSALSIPRRHTDGHFALMLPKQIIDM